MDTELRDYYVFLARKTLDFFGEGATSVAPSSGSRLRDTNQGEITLSDVETAALEQVAEDLQVDITVGDEVDSQEYSEQELFAMKLMSLRDLAIGRSLVEPKAAKGLDKPALVALLSKESTPEAEPDEEDGLTEAEIREMDVDELTDIAQSVSIDIKDGMTQEDLVNAIIDYMRS